MLTSAVIAPSLVVAYVCRAFGVAEYEIRGTSRGKHISRARRTAAWLLLECCGMSLEDVGAELNRHHTSIIYQRDTAQKEMESEGWQQAIRLMVERIEQEAMRV